MLAIRLGDGPVLRLHDLPGAGRPLILLHGLGCASSSDYPTVARAPGLRKRRLLPAAGPARLWPRPPLDLLLQRADHATVVLGVLDRLRLDRCDVYGHSMGGTVAIILAAIDPARIAHLVLSEPNLDPGGGVFSRAISQQSEEEYVRLGHEATLASASASGNLPWAGTLRASDPVAVHRSAASLVRGADPSWRDILCRLAMRRTVLFGDRSLPDPDYLRLPGLGIDVRVVENAGHSMAWDNPAGLGRAIAASCGERVAFLLHPSFPLPPPTLPPLPSIVPPLPSPPPLLYLLSFLPPPFPLPPPPSPPPLLPPSNNFSPFPSFPPPHPLLPSLLSLAFGSPLITRFHPCPLGGVRPPSPPLGRSPPPSFLGWAKGFWWVGSELTSPFP